MNTYIISFVLLFSQSFNTCQYTGSNPKVKAYIIESNFADFDTLNNEWYVKKYWPSYTKLFFLNDQVMVQKSYLNTPMQFENNVLIKRDSTEIRYYTFVYSTNDTSSVYIETNKLETAKIVPKDSVINTLSAFDNHIERGFLSKKLSLISTHVNKNGDLIEDYCLKIEDETMPDTTATGWLSLRFTGKQEKNPVYQMSPYIENLRKRRLAEYKLGVSPSKAGEGQLASRGFETFFRLSELKMENEAEILKLFEFAKKKLE